MKPGQNDLLAVCEQEKLNYSNAIQTFGVLVIIDTDQVVTHISSNFSQYFQLSTDEFLGQPISKLFLQTFDTDYTLPFGLKNRKVAYSWQTIDNQFNDVIFSELDNGWLVEIQPIVAENTMHTTANHYMSALAQPATGSDLNHYMLDVIKIVKQLSGFEKVMLYQFQEDWSGEVISEYGGDEYFERYLGLRFPATDIPKIARDLYLKTPYRLICDVNAPTAALITANTSLPPVDLTYSDLRSVSPMHINYLKNMDVGASLSFPVVINNQLWGLIALHHPTATYLSAKLRHECSEITKIFALSLRGFFASEHMQLIDRLDYQIEQIIQGLPLHDSIPEDIGNMEQALLNIAHASSGAFIIGSEVMPFGLKISEETIRSIDYWYRAKHDSETVFHTDNLSGLIPEAAKWGDQISGMLTFQVNANPPMDKIRLYWFRPELPQEINWAGNPEKKLSETKGGLAVTPRTSFDKWTKITKGHSSPWLSADILMATKFRAFMVQSVLK